MIIPPLFEQGSFLFSSHQNHFDNSGRRPSANCLNARIFQAGREITTSNNPLKRRHHEYLQHADNPGLPPLVATADELQDAEFIREVMAKDIVIGLSRDGQDSWFIWGDDIPLQLISGTLKWPPKVIRIQIDFSSGEIENYIRAVHRIKEGVSSSPRKGLRQMTLD